MYNLPLKIRRGLSPTRPTTAWFLPGSAAHLWLEELIRWDILQTELVLRVVPTGTNDRRPRGLLVTTSGKNQVNTSPRCHPYGQLGGRLYLPVDAGIEPEVTEQEIEELLAGTETLYLWHPATGLVGFEPSDSFRLEDLLILPAAGMASYDAAQPGLHLNNRLLSVTPLDPQPIDQFLAEAGGDIGTDSPELDKLAAATDRPKRPLLDRIKRATLAGLVGAASWIERKEKKQAERAFRADKSDGGSLAGWIQRRFQQSEVPGLQEKRNKAIDRLLEMLRQTPDLGLRYALPVSGGDGHRGLAPPASQLGKQNVDFNLGGLTASGPADAWDIDERARQRLIEQYRQLANREIAMGRHRRAAYIFGHLLGDLHGAASALKAGGHWREASQVYLELLKRPMAAAECLEEGGLWSEAVGLYEQLEEIERAGDLYRRMEQPVKAERAFRRAIDLHLANTNYLAAASIQSEKLAAPREAIRILARGWPRSAQARACMVEFFRLQGKLGTHEMAASQIASLADRHCGSTQAEMLAKVLAQVAGDYPDDGVQRLAKDKVRLLAGECLRDARPDTVKGLLELVAQLEPADRLLGRDCRRFQTQSERRSQKPAPRPCHVPRMLGEIQLPQGVSWQATFSMRDGFYAAGFRDRRPLVVRAAWAGESVEILSFGPLQISKKFGIASSEPNMQLVPANTPDRVWLHCPGFEPGPTLEFAKTDRFPRVGVGGLSWLEPSVLAFGNTPCGRLWTVHRDDDSLIASEYHEETLVHTTTIPVPEPWLENAQLLDRLLLFVSQSIRVEAVVGLGRYLFLLRANKRPKPIDLEPIGLGQPIRSITAAGDSANFVLLIATDTGGIAVWPPWETARIEPFVSDMNEPVLGVVHKDWILAVDDTQLQMFRFHYSKRRIFRQGTDQPRTTKPVAILEMPALDQFALLRADGRMQQYQLPVPATGLS